MQTKATDMKQRFVSRGQGMLRVLDGLTYQDYHSILKELDSYVLKLHYSTDYLYLVKISDPSFRRSLNLQYNLKE